jgi:hypothetical protein
VVIVMIVQRRWKCLRWGAPSTAMVKSSPGRPWSAVRALPRHAVQACAWATGECHPLLLLFYPLFFGRGYWPTGHDRLRRAHKHGAMMLIIVVCWMIVFSYLLLFLMFGFS